MDVFDDEILKLWRSLLKNKVMFIMIGGVATNLHGFHRTTDDIDIWIKDNLENRKNLRNAFKEYGLGDFEALETIQFIPGWTDFYLDNSLRMDIMTSVKGLEDFGFDKCLEYASIATIYELEIPFLHINQLIDSKKAANRPKDQIDIIELENIKKLRNN
ncbi:DUF6036 family nucleotidyltransferase [Pedobacter roseus]|uniref:DUF6036 domain-containing protein n=1 Tax=Pedobacter roseus TaxID=336820 RepID=A0A7G9QMJ7_9SPHI|nr:DUF6036 family nucleotidyltransferase [Pedobacter roseus]QNN44572.1 hypothetical protein H9L23_11065 [Pedobacter roseus]